MSTTASQKSIEISDKDRLGKYITYAIYISWFSIIYNCAEGVVSVVFGEESDSLDLMFFGIQSCVELLSSFVVLWKIAKTRYESNNLVALKKEQRATLIIGILYFIMALATIASGIVALARHSSPQISLSGIIIPIIASVIMAAMWLIKKDLAKKINSSTLNSDAKCSFACIRITVLVFVGNIVYRFWNGGWWIDGAVTLVLGVLFFIEGVEMIRWGLSKDFTGGCCKSCAGPSVSQQHGKEENCEGSGCCGGPCGETPGPVKTEEIAITDRNTDSCCKGKEATGKKCGKGEIEKVSTSKGCCSKEKKANTTNSCSKTKENSCCKTSCAEQKESSLSTSKTNCCQSSSLNGGKDLEAGLSDKNNCNQPAKENCCKNSTPCNKSSADQVAKKSGCCTSKQKECDQLIQVCSSNVQDTCSSKNEQSCSRQTTSTMNTQKIESESCKKSKCCESSQKSIETEAQAKLQGQCTKKCCPSSNENRSVSCESTTKKEGCCNESQRTEKTTVPEIKTGGCCKSEAKTAALPNLTTCEKKKDNCCSKSIQLTTSTTTKEDCCSKTSQSSCGKADSEEPKSRKCCGKEEKSTLQESAKFKQCCQESIDEGYTEIQINQTTAISTLIKS